MAAFQEATFLPDPSQLRLDRIAALMALLLGEPLRTSALELLYPSYTSADSTYIWPVWEPHIRPPKIHPLAEGTLTRDTVLALLRRDYIASEDAAGDNQALTNLVVISIPVETFILYTVVTLQEEERAVRTPSYPYPLLGFLAFLPFNNGALAAILSRSGHLIERLSTRLRRTLHIPSSGSRPPGRHT